ncbi:hypothetical protein SDC9_124918 [bioreactor metagenome]|uniref:Uncharacterized protein n=1 Tax=bioreactor metagenome TaxID=1076179 RepID=A0A645CLZ7_9ZZZZ
MTLPATVRAVWKSAELLIAFHKDRKREARAEPHLWRPKDAFARLLARPEDQEAFVVVRGEEDGSDVQIKLHPDKLVIRRDQSAGWSGVIVQEDRVSVMVHDVWVHVDHNGGVKVESGDNTTFLEGDGSILRLSPEAEIIVSGDGRRMSRRTEGQLDAFTEEGFVSRKK